MKIIDNVLIKVIDEDIENGCFIVSDDIVSIEEFDFYNCG